MVSRGKPQANKRLNTMPERGLEDPDGDHRVQHKVDEHFPAACAGSDA